MSGTGYPKTSASNANQAVFRTTCGISGSSTTATKLSRPTHVGASVRFVS